MSKETRMKSNRNLVADRLAKAADLLRKASAELTTAADLLKAVQEAERLVKSADGVANSAPGGSYKPLPAVIRNKTARAVSTLEALAQAVRDTPVSKDERAVVKHRRAVRV